MEYGRVQKSAKNVVFSLLFYFLDLVLKFITRTIFIRCLIIELLGLNGLFSNIISILSLTELGFGAALTFVMYKPMAENNTRKIGAIYNFYKKIYLIIILILLGISLLLMPALPFMVKNEVPTSVNMYIVYIIYVINIIITYFSAPNKSLLIAAQRNDLNSKTEILKVIFLNIMQISMLLLFRNYYFYIIFMPLSSLLEYLILKLIVHFKYGSLLKETKKEKIDYATKHEIKVNTGAILLHKISGTIVLSTDNILISSLIGLTVLGIYSNYFLIINAVIALLSAVINALSGSVGNIIAADKNRCYLVFTRLNFIYTMMIIFCTVCLVCLLQPFVTIWAGPQFMFDISTVVLLVISFYMQKNRNLLLAFKECAGLMNKDQCRAIVEAVINLVVSIVLAQFMGINGIILGTIISTITGPLITEPYVVYKYLFQKSVWQYHLKFLFYTIVAIIIAISMWFFINLWQVTSVGSFIGVAFACAGGTGILMLLAFGWTKDFWDVFKWGLSIIKRKPKATPINTKSY